MFDIKFFPNKNAVGTFSPFDQVIRLDGFTQEDVRTMLNGDYVTKWKNSFTLFRTIFHEYTHFLDMTTTTYGLSVLSAIFEASVSFSSNKNSAIDLGANKARNVFNEMNKDAMHAAVTSSYRKTWGYRPWLANARSYPEDEPHVLAGTIFINPENREEIARAPFSIPSLLESNALANELFFCHAYSQSKVPADKDIKQLQDSVSTEILQLIYDERFSLYSVCFHRCANVINKSV